MLYQSTKNTIPLEQWLVKICTRFKPYNEEQYKKTNLYNVLLYFCESCLRNNYFGSLTTTRECGTNDAVKEILPDNDLVIDNIITTRLGSLIEILANTRLKYGQRIAGVRFRGVGASTRKSVNYGNNRRSTKGNAYFILQNTLIIMC